MFSGRGTVSGRGGYPTATIRSPVTGPGDRKRQDTLLFSIRGSVIGVTRPPILFSVLGNCMASWSVHLSAIPFVNCQKMEMMLPLGMWAACDMLKVVVDREVLHFLRGVLRTIVTH